MKTCNRCNIEKPADAFYQKRTSKDGLFWWCRECHKERMKSRYHDLATSSSYREAEKDRVATFWVANPEKRTEADKRYREAHRGKINAKTKKRYADKKQRTPAWLTEDDFWLMEQAYELADMRTKMLGFSWHVDHVLPLQGRLVSGLHVPDNLKVVPALENRRKSNSFIPT